MTDTDLMIHVLNHLPIGYETLVEKLELEIEAKMNPITLEGLRAQLQSKYCRLQKASTDTEAETELATG